MAIHAHIARVDQVEAFRELGIIPSFFPMHTFYWGDWHRDTVFGAERATNLAPTGWALERGMIFSSHHDAPVAKPDSMRVLDATINRATRSGKVLETIKEGHSVYLRPVETKVAAQATGCSASDACFGLATESLAKAGLVEAHNED